MLKRMKRRTRALQLVVASVVPMMGFGCLVEENLPIDESERSAEWTTPQEPYQIDDQGVVRIMPIAGEHSGAAATPTAMPVPAVETPEGFDSPPAGLELSLIPAQNSIRMGSAGSAVTPNETITLSVVHAPAMARFKQTKVLERNIAPGDLLALSEIEEHLPAATDNDDVVIVKTSVCISERICRPDSEMQFTWDGDNLVRYDNRAAIEALISSNHPFAILCKHDPSTCSLHDGRGRKRELAPEAYEGGENDRE